MTASALDASVAMKWLVPEAGSDVARRLLDVVDSLFLAPDLLFAEMAQTIWKKRRRGEIAATESTELLAALPDLPIRSIPCRELAADAGALASTLGHSAYDCLYLVLALRLDIPVITADQRLASLAVQYPNDTPKIKLLA